MPSTRLVGGSDRGARARRVLRRLELERRGRRASIRRDPVLAPPNPLRSINGDAAYIAERVRQIDEPALLVGHSYGGGQ
jgi:pimeloyl-ACP methyl ester carboxylesterase